MQNDWWKYEYENDMKMKRKRKQSRLRTMQLLTISRTIYKGNKNNSDYVLMQQTNKQHINEFVRILRYKQN